MLEKCPDRETRNAADPIVQSVLGKSAPTDSREKNQGLLNEMLGSGFAVFGIDKAGYIQYVHGTSNELLREFNIWNDPLRSELLTEWNERLWACITGSPNQALQIKLIDPRDGYTGVVAWSNEKPSVLQVALTSLKNIGFELDPAWGQFFSPVL